MSLQRSRIKKKRKTQKEKDNLTGTLLKSFSSNAIVFQKNIDTKTNQKTDLNLWPASIIVGFEKDNSLFIEYVSTGNPNNDEEFNKISAFFSQMKQGDPFSVSSCKIDDGILKATTTVEGNYKFQAYLKEGHIIAEADHTFDSEYRRKRIRGRFINKCPQYSKESPPKSQKQTSLVINYLQEPSFINLDIRVGDIIEPIGSQFNDEKYTVLNVRINGVDGKQEIQVSPQIKKDENRIAKLTSFNVYRKSSSDIIHQPGDPNVDMARDALPYASTIARRSVISTTPVLPPALQTGEAPPLQSSPMPSPPTEY